MLSYLGFVSCIAHAPIDVPITSACVRMLVPDVQRGGCLLVPVTPRKPLGAECLTFLGRLWNDFYTCLTELVMAAPLHHCNW